MNWFEEYIYEVQAMSNARLLEEIKFLLGDVFDGQRRTRSEKKLEVAMPEFEERLWDAGYLSNS